MKITTGLSASPRKASLMKFFLIVCALPGALLLDLWAQDNQVELQVDGHYLKAALEITKYESEAQLDQAALEYYESDSFRERIRRREINASALIGGIPMAANASDLEWGRFKERLKTLHTTRLDAKSRSYYLESKGLKIIADTWIRAIELGVASKVPPLEVAVTDSEEVSAGTITISFKVQGVSAKIEDVIAVGCEQRREIGGSLPFEKDAYFPSSGKSAVFHKLEKHPYPFVIVHTSLGTGVAALKPYGLPPSPPAPPPSPPDPISERELVFPAGELEARPAVISGHLAHQDWAVGPNALAYKVRWKIHVDPDWKVRLKLTAETWDVKALNDGYTKMATFQDEVVKDFGGRRRMDSRLKNYDLIIHWDEPAEYAEAGGGTEPGKPLVASFSGPQSTIVTSCEGNVGGGGAEGAFWKLKYRSFKLVIVPRY